MAHIHYAFALAFFLALNLHLIEDLFELGLGHELFIGALVNHLFTRLQLDEVVDELILRERVLVYALNLFCAAQPRCWL